MPHIPRVLCMQEMAETEMVIVQTGALVEMMTPAGPYYKIYVDKYRCPRCEAEVALPARAVVAEHWQPDYDKFSGATQVAFATE